MLLLRGWFNWLDFLYYLPVDNETFVVNSSISRFDRGILRGCSLCVFIYVSVYALCALHLSCFSKKNVYADVMKREIGVMAGGDCMNDGA